MPSYSYHYKPAHTKARDAFKMRELDWELRGEAPNTFQEPIKVSYAQKDAAKVIARKYGLTLYWDAGNKTWMLRGDESNQSHRIGREMINALS